MDCSPPGSSVHGILHARTLEWVAIPFSRGSSRPKDRTWISSIEGFFFFFLTYRATREAHIKVKGWYYYFCDHPFVCLSRVLEALRLPVLWRGFAASATMVIVLTKPLREVATPGGPLGHLASPSFPATALLDLCPFSHHSEVLPIYIVGICGKTLPAVLIFRGAEVFFCISLQWRTMRRLKSKANRGPGICLHLGFCHDMKTHGFRV